jgi:hypothetical protein
MSNSPPPVVEAMLAQPGVYLAGDPPRHLLKVVIYVDEQGQAWSMKPDIALRRDGWYPDVEIRGPLNLESPLI